MTPYTWLRLRNACGIWQGLAYRRTWRQVWQEAREYEPTWTGSPGCSGLFWCWLAGRLGWRWGEGAIDVTPDMNLALGCLPFEAWMEALRASEKKP